MAQQEIALKDIKDGQRVVGTKGDSTITGYVSGEFSRGEVWVRLLTDKEKAESGRWSDSGDEDIIDVSLPETWVWKVEAPTARELVTALKSGQAFSLSSADKTIRVRTDEGYMIVGRNSVDTYKLSLINNYPEPEFKVLN